MAVSVASAVYWDSGGGRRIHVMVLVGSCRESISISELPVLGNLPIEAASYLGMQLLVDVYDDDDDGEERTYFGPVAGTVINKFIFDSVRDTISIVSEAQYLVYFDDNEEDFRVLLGLRILIP
jgi:hypothetical protein